ncbi:MAG: hypothetical protein Q9191_001672 [Dirinaria sp. TL-2023a]
MVISFINLLRPVADNRLAPPDVTKHTRIVSVLGIEPKWASPRDDGWFLSDFLAFWHVLNRLTSSQTWLHCLDLDKLIGEHKRYLHGSPFEPRKEVLNETMLAKMKTTCHAPEYVGGMSIRKVFTEAVHRECKAADEEYHNVLILMFGHGVEGKGIDIEVTTKKRLRFEKLQKILQRK